jgi:hypothetical protein
MGNLHWDNRRRCYHQNKEKQQSRAQRSQITGEEAQANDTEERNRHGQNKK